MQKQAFFFRIENICFALKKTVKIDVSTYESVQQVGVPGSILMYAGSVLSEFWVFLCIFMKVYMTFEPFLSLLSRVTQKKKRVLNCL